MDYENTPSYYNNEEYFNKYLNCTSYYKGLQHITEKIIKLTHAKNVLELGSALGTTTMLLAEELKDITFVGTDIRQDIVSQASKKSYETDIENLRFFTSDMTELVKNSEIEQYDLIYMLYSFHHIVDPMSNKVQFLEDCYKNMKDGGYLLIGETFTPEESKTCDCNREILENLYKLRSLEGYTSTFWKTLNGLSDDDINKAKDIGDFCRTEELKAGEQVIKRDDEYFVKLSWLKKTAEDAGYKVILDEPVNSISESIILLQK